tara:strand:+ start:470 stop:865 length:396 start_codon:yes stop_codon:yes gene_type:complete
MAALNETRNATINDASMASQGLLVKHHANGVMKTAAVTDVSVGVTAAESSRDAAGAYEGATTGTVAVYPLSGIVYVKCMAISTAEFGEPLYVGTDDGFVDDSASNSAVKVGYYAGEAKSIAAGDLVPMFCL